VKALVRLLRNAAAVCDTEEIGGPHLFEDAAAELERLGRVADSEGARAVTYLRRARKAEAEIERLRCALVRVKLQAPSLADAQVVAIEALRANDGPQDEDAPSPRLLRRLLALRVAMPHTYYDDGEAQGQELGISIDFMREPVADIDAKLRALNVARAIAAGKAPGHDLDTPGRPAGHQ
jgi:hypothetical protein